MWALILQINLHLLEQRLGNERVSNILWCVGIIFATLLLKRPLSRWVAKLCAVIANRFTDKNHGRLFQDLTVRPLEWLLQTLLYYIAVNQLTIFLRQVVFRRLHGSRLTIVRVSDVADKIFQFLLILFLTLVVSRIVDFIFQVRISKARAEDNRDREQLFPLVKEVFKVIFWTIGIFWILGDVFNVNIPALITGLGIGGIAIALAAKESVENLFAAFTILSDKPFKTGDAVRLGTFEGSVEQIGFRSTRVRNADGSLYIIPNKTLVSQNLENLSQRDTRKGRIVFSIKYGLSEHELRTLIKDLKEMVQQTLHVQEPVDVFADAFGETSFQLSINYHLPEPLAEGARADAIRQEIALQAFRMISDATRAGNRDAVVQEPSSSKPLPGDNT